jgi:hypothetical protein
MHYGTYLYIWLRAHFTLSQHNRNAFQNLGLMTATLNIPETDENLSRFSQRRQRPASSHEGPRVYPPRSGNVDVAATALERY